MIDWVMRFSNIVVTIIFLFLQLLNIYKLKKIHFENLNEIKKIKNIIIKQNFSKQNSIVAQLIANKRKSTNKIILIILCFIIIFDIMKNFNIGNVNEKIYNSLYIILCLIIVSQITTLYRYRKDFYGTNYIEAKELVYFIAKNNNNISKNGTPIFNEETKEVMKPDKNVEYT